MDWYLLLRFLHITSGILLVGGLVARQFVDSLANRADNVRDFAAFTQGAGVIERRMILPGSVAVFIFGIILALHTDTPILGFLQGASQNWLLLALLLLISMSLVGPLVLQPRARKLEQLLTEALASGKITSELSVAAADPMVRAGRWYEVAAVVVVVALMVFKPF